MTVVHFQCDRLPELNLGSNTGLSPSKYVRFLMKLTGEEIDVCIDLYDKIVRRAMIGGHFNHLDHEEFGPFTRVVEVIRHKGGRRRDVTGMGPVYEDVTATILYYSPWNAAWRLAKVTCEASRPSNLYGGNEAKKWKEKAIETLLAEPSQKRSHETV